MKKHIAVLLSLCLLLLALAACSGQQGEEELASMENPITEYASLDEINEIGGGSLMHPAVMGVSDESFFVIDCGDYKIEEYRFSVNGTPYVYRFADNLLTDISGIYADGGQLFAGGADKGTEFKEFDGGKAARSFNMDGQYVLIVEDKGQMEMETFQAIAEEMFSLAEMEDDYDAAAEAFVGDWHEQIAGRGQMSVTTTGSQVDFLVHWSNSAAEMWIWEFSGTVDENGVIEYADGLKTSHLFDEEGNETLTTLSESNSGRIWLDENDQLHWIDDESGNEEGSVFERD